MKLEPNRENWHFAWVAGIGGFHSKTNSIIDVFLANGLSMICLGHACMQRILGNIE